MDIGIIGAGNIGRTVGLLWAQAGHAVLFASRHPGTLTEFAATAGPAARVGTAEEAAAFGEVVLLSLPLGALAAVAPALAPMLAGKVVLDTANPYPERDGTIAEEVLRAGRGTGVAVAAWLPGARVVRAFSTVWDRTLAEAAHRAPPRLAIPLASDDAGALEIAAGLVRDAGFDPVPVGALADAARFDPGTAGYNVALDAPALRRVLGLAGV